MEVDKNDPWGIIPWKQYVNYARMGQTTPTHTTHLNQLLEAAKRPGYARPSVTFKDIVEGVYFDLTDAPYDMYEEEYEWEVPIKKGIDFLAKKNTLVYIQKKRYGIHRKDHPKVLYLRRMISIRNKP